MSSDLPDYTAILDDLLIGNLATAKTLHEHPELGITHVLSVCPDYPEAEVARDGATAEGDAPSPTVSRPLHRCVSVQDSEYEDILMHLPSAVAFIREALEPSDAHAWKNEGQQTEADEQDGRQQAECSSREASSSVSIRKYKVLVHCVMGVSRSTTVVCAYLMTTRNLSFPAALMFIRKRRPRVHPNYGFQRQLQIFGDCGRFSDYPAPIRSHPAYATWQRKKKREVAKYLSRLDDMVDIKLDDKANADITMTDDFTTDQLEASSLLNEVGATHLLTISPAPLPPSLTPPPSTAFRPRRPSGLLSSSMSPASSPDSDFPSPLSSRSSSFSNGSRLSSPVSTPSTAATSVLSLPSLLPPSKLRLEVSSSDSDEEFENGSDEVIDEPDYLALAGVEHHHIPLKESDPNSLLFCLSEAVFFIQQALHDGDEGSESEKDLNPRDGRNYKDDRRKHVLIYCTTESRACAVVCAYLMACKGLTPSRSYSVLEEAQPLFNPTKAFVAQLEMFHDCDFNPTPDHPRVHAWLSGEPKPALPNSDPSDASHLSPSFSIGNSRIKSNGRATAHWKVESDTEGDDSISLRRKLGTPMRCGSFSNAYMQSSTSASQFAQSQSGSADLHGPASRPSMFMPTSGMDVEKLLHRFQGVGDPDFAFDVEAFRGALRGITAAEKEKRTNSHSRVA